MKKKKRHPHKEESTKMRLEPGLTRAHYNIVSKLLEFKKSVSDRRRIVLTTYFTNVSMYFYERIYLYKYRDKYLLRQGNGFIWKCSFDRTFSDSVYNDETMRGIYALLLREVHKVKDDQLQRYWDWIRPFRVSKASEALLYREGGKYRQQDIRGAGRLTKNIFH